MRKKIIALLCALTISSTFAVSCAQKIASGATDGGTTALSYDVWGTDNLTTVVQNPDYNNEYNVQKVGLTYEMAKGESENDQIIITAKSNIKSFSLTTSDLKCGDNVLSKDNIEVFVQRYIYCDDVSKWAGYKNLKDDKARYYEYNPDMLMYQDVCIREKENTVSAGNNQGITVVVKTDENTVAGKYEGNFVLTVEGEETLVPVTVTVWNFTMGKATGRTLFYPQQLAFINGEFDNTDDMFRTYYEIGLDYDINAEYLPGYFSFKFNTDVDGFIAELKKYYEHPNFTCFSLPNYELGQWGVMDSQGRELLKTFMFEVAKASTKEKPYIEKMVLNHDSLDEPQLSNSVGRVRTLYTAVYEIEEEVIAQLENENFFAEYSAEEKQKFCETIRNMPQICTTNYGEMQKYYGDSWDIDLINVYCPEIYYYDNNCNYEEYRNSREKSGGEQWFYTCNQPKYPYPVHFTETELIANRVLRWMQFKYGVEGYLYWGINYCGEARNPYTETKVWAGNPNGDGYFFYSGRPYGSKPFPTVKLLSFQDGQEDMDLLYAVENEYIKVSKNYGISEKDAQNSFNALFARMADLIIDGATYNFDYTQLISLRRQLAKLYETLLQGELVTYSVEGTNAKVTVLSQSEEFTVDGEKVNATSVSANRYRYEKQVDLTEKAYTVSVNTEKSDLSLFVSKTRKQVSCSVETVKVNGATTVNVNEKGAILFKFETKNDDITFYPKVTFGAGLFGVSNFSSVDNIRFTYTNNSAEDYELVLSLGRGSNLLEADRYLIKAGETRDISLALVYNNQFGVDYTRYISKTDSFVITVFSQSGNNLSAILKDMTYTLKGDK